MLQDRYEAGRRLGQRLRGYEHRRPVVVALPRGGVPVGYEVARALNAPMDVLVVRKLGCPGQPELAIGAISNGRYLEILMNEGLCQEMTVPSKYIEREIEAKIREIRAMEGAYRNHRPAIGLAGRTVIVVDDGIATGATMRVAVRRIRREKPEKIIVATPVASEEAVETMRKEVDEIVCLGIPKRFIAVGGYYRDFQPVSNEEVSELLDRVKPDAVERPG